MRKLAAFTTLALTVAVAACSGSPTSADPVNVPPHLDGGVFGGSGNSLGTKPPPTTTATETNQVTAADSSSRGGVFGGSGN